MTDDQAHDVGSLADPAHQRELPVTARGLKTRESLVSAARRVFERDGFIHSRLTDITAEAACSIGTFYTYFDTKEEVFSAVMHAAQNDMLNPGFPRVDDGPQNFTAVVAATNRAYFEAYQRNAKLMALLEQVATINPEFRALRLERSRLFVDRAARRIVAFQDAGYVDRSLDAFMTALALSSMMSRLAYYSFVLGEDLDIDAMVETSTHLWANALKFDAVAALND